MAAGKDGVIKPSQTAKVLPMKLLLATVGQGLLSLRHH